MSYKKTMFNDLIKVRKELYKYKKSINKLNNKAWYDIGFYSRGNIAYYINNSIEILEKNDLHYINKIFYQEPRFMYLTDFFTINNEIVIDLELIESLLYLIDNLIELWFNNLNSSNLYKYIIEIEKILSIIFEN